jgi:hypothetical protein
MSNMIRGLVLAGAGWLLCGPIAVAQAPSVDALNEQVTQLKKQLADQKARADQLAVQVERLADRLRQIEGPTRPTTGPVIVQDPAQVQAAVEKALVQLKDEEVRLAQIGSVVGADHPDFLAQQQRVVAARKLVADTQATLAELRKTERPQPGAGVTAAEHRTLLERVKQLEQRVVDLEKLVPKVKPGDQ